jgi:hypothetical protein
LTKKSKFYTKTQNGWRTDLKENPERNFNFDIDLTSSRCKKIKEKFRRIIKLKNPDFNVSFSSKTVKLARFFTPKKNQ